MSKDAGIIELIILGFVIILFIGALYAVSPTLGVSDEIPHNILTDICESIYHAVTRS